MLKRLMVAALVLGAVLAAGCSRKPPAPTVHASMVEIVAPSAQVIWDITNRAYNEKGDGFVASKISSADWDKLSAAGQRLNDRGALLSKTAHIRSAVPGATIMGEGGGDAAGAKQVQAFIDANPALFAQRARILADAGLTIVKASKTHDIAPLYEVASGMDEVCDGCHKPFWGTDDPPPWHPPAGG